MKKKTQISLLFIVVIVLFVTTFFTINLKYDKFYRVKGINNDNRALIEKYLTDDEQTYLVENQIPLSQFMKYIEYDDFQLSNYRYYNLLADTQRYKSDETILKTGNEIVNHLSELYSTNYFSVGQSIIENDLEYAFINDDSFDVNAINLYSIIRPLYDEKSTAYVSKTTEYVENLESRSFSDEQIEDFLNDVVSDYNAESLSSLMSNKDTKITLVPRPSDNTLILNGSQFIGSYTPRNLVLLQDIPRFRYDMYLTKNAYNQLKKMIDENKELKRLVVQSSYISYDKFENNEYGYDEQQLGTTLMFKKRNQRYNEFENSDISNWLKSNSYKYGFILRYKEDDTRYDVHRYRFVGVDLAKTLYSENKTLEEYLQESEEE